jgi:hypothetical protein
MTIVERVDVLERMLETVRDQENVQQKVGKAQERAGSLLEVGNRLEELVDAVHELSQAGREMLGSAAAQAKGTLADLRHALDEVRRNPIAPVDTDFAPLVDQCKEFVRDMTAWAQGEWSGVRGAMDIPAVDEDLLDQLEASGLEMEEVRGPLASAEADLMLIDSRDLPREGDFNRLRACSDKLQGAIARLEELLPPAVAQFISEASKHPGAPLALLTEQVWTFLMDQEIESRYHVRLV